MADNDSALLAGRNATRTAPDPVTGRRHPRGHGGRRHGHRDAARPLARPHVGHSAPVSPRHAAVPDDAVPRGVRALLVVAAVVVSLMGLLLMALPTRTATWFAWTIDVPMTAVFLGSAYVSSAVLLIAAARSSGGAGARLTSWTVLVVAILTLIVTVVHVDVLHLGGDRPTSAWLVAGGWLATWAAVPLIMWIALRVQARGPRTARATRQPLPRVLRGLLLALAVVLIGTGAGLIASPTWVADAWSWPLTSLTAGVVGASLVGYGWAAGHASLVGGAQDVLPLGWGFGAFATLHALSLLRHGDDLDRLGWQVWAYLVVLAWACVVSAWILLTGAGAAARESSR